MVVSHVLSFSLHIKLVETAFLHFAYEEIMSLVTGSAGVFRSKPNLIPKSIPLIILHHALSCVATLSSTSPSLGSHACIVTSSRCFGTIS